MIWAVLQSASSGHCYATNAKQTSLERNFLADMNSITVDHGNCSPRLQAPIQGVSSSIQRHCNVKCMQIFCTTIKKGNSKWVIRMVRIHKDQGRFYSHYFMCRYSLGIFDCWYIDNLLCFAYEGMAYAYQVPLSNLSLLKQQIPPFSEYSLSNHLQMRNHNVISLGRHKSCQ